MVHEYRTLGLAERQARRPGKESNNWKHVAVFEIQSCSGLSGVTNIHAMKTKVFTTTITGPYDAMTCRCPTEHEAPFCFSPVNHAAE